MSGLTAEQLETGRRNLLAQLRQSLDRDLTEYPVDAATMRELVQVLESLAPHPSANCRTCNGREWVNGQWVATRETVGMVCQTCGHDYAAEPVGVSRERLVELLKAELPSAYQFMAWSLVETLTAAGALRVDPPACGAENTRHPEWKWGPCVFTAGHHDHTREDWNPHADRLGRTWNDQPSEEEL